MLPGIRRAAESVFGREDRRHVEARPVKQVHEMHPPCGIGPGRSGHLRHGGLVGQHGHALPPDEREIGRRVGNADQHPS